MKNIIATLILLSTACAHTSEVTSDGFTWLSGDWERTNNTPGEITTESWRISPNQKLEGIGLTLRGKDTVFYEYMSIASIKGEIYLTVHTPQHKDAVRFKVTAKGEASFTAENPENDFPKKIVYKKTDEGMQATISGGNNAIDFLFKKIRKNRILTER